VRRIILEGGRVAGGTGGTGGADVVEPDAGISTVTDTLTMPDLPSLLADRT